jgi:hypothetical protein
MVDTPDLLTRLWLTAKGQSWQPQDATAQYPYYDPRSIPGQGAHSGPLDTGHSAMTDVLRALQGPTYTSDTIPRGEPVQDTLYNNLNPDSATAAAGASDSGNIYSAAFWHKLLSGRSPW